MELENIKDIIQESGETKNQIVLTCTATAKNKYAEQAVNWTINFEKFNDMWVGTSLSMGYEEFQLYDEIPEGDIGGIITQNYLNTAYFEIQDIQVDTESRTVAVHCIQYADYWSFYSETDVNINLRWDDSNMEWVYSNTEYINDPTYVISSDISLDYERNSKNLSESFSIEQDNTAKGIYQLKNYHCTYYNRYDLFSPQTHHKLDNQVITWQFKSGYELFDRDYGIGTLIASYRSTNSRIIRFIVNGDTLYYISPYNITETLSIKTDIQRGELGFWSKDVTLWQGQIERT